jgi:hypothetical protein
MVQLNPPVCGKRTDRSTNYGKGKTNILFTRWDNSDELVKGILSSGSGRETQSIKMDSTLPTWTGRRGGLLLNLFQKGEIRLKFTQNIRTQNLEWMCVPNTSNPLGLVWWKSFFWMKIDPVYKGNRTQKSYKHPQTPCGLQRPPTQALDKDLPCPISSQEWWGERI